MNHISEITKHPDFYTKDFLILGTGPSLDNFDWQKHGDKNIIAIYSAEQSCAYIFIHFCPDANYFKSDEPIRAESEYLVTRAFNHELFSYLKFDPTTESGFTNPNHFYEYDCDITNYPNPNHEIPYDGVFHGGDGKRYFPFHEPFECSCTIKMIALFLGKAGIKKVFTCGVDGGTGYSKYVTGQQKTDYETIPQNFDGENKDFYDTCERYGIQTIKI